VPGISAWQVSTKARTNKPEGTWAPIVAAGSPGKPVMLPAKNKGRIGLKRRFSILLTSRFLTTNLPVGRKPKQLSKGRAFLTG